MSSSDVVRFGATGENYFEVQLHAAVDAATGFQAMKVTFKVFDASCDLQNQAMELPEAGKAMT